MRIYKLVNPDKAIIIVLAADPYEAIQKAKVMDQYKFNETQYTIKKKLK